MVFRHRQVIDTLPSYKQGKPAPQVEGQRSFKISSNENPHNPLPSVQKAIADQALGHINRYPDMRGWAVVEKLAQQLGVSSENIQLGCGSTEVITQLVNLVAGKGDEVIYPWRSFEAYPIIVTTAGATSVQVPLTAEGKHDIDAMIAAINDRTRLVIVNNPNNPTSTSVSDVDVRRLLEAVPDDVLVLIDEAYVQFNTDAETCIGLDLFHEYSNVIVAQTFSKAYGLAGLRIGYAVGPQDVIDGMRKVALPFGVSDVAQVAAVASLDAYAELSERVDALIMERERVVSKLREQGWQIPEPYANFFWLQLGERSDEIAHYFELSGLSVRVFSGEGIRITIAEREANDLVIDVCARTFEIAHPQAVTV
ncbi:histidinol-phosphate transaminase [Bifidobacterium sp.]|jgi:histidinol-phosphate aminotransferase|uniref:histidinol-phosphate transaminase n=1 Tax=Bifidobacterium sp. TaxID=41200 RepID=UPI0025BCFE36|nr:histidinol-phosphate transaminase [Bifidobacterium sp.]MCH4175605.1 histidinol-phosphate transaminase [Bifidobacterium sp.]MCI1635262.1 histidinol-phosphate transaminase [Bifidobacterium sp.]